MRDGDYITIRAVDTLAERDSGVAQMQEQGCRSVSCRALPDGRLQVHGYLRMLDCAKCQQPASRLVGAWCEACAQ